MNALITLMERVVRGTLRDFDLLIAVVVPVSTFIGFTFVLKHVIDTGAMSYSQYVLPAIVVQSLLFGAVTTAERAARDEASGFGRRIRTLPISTFAPLVARMLYCLLRSVVVIVVAVAVAYPFGFRLAGGVGYSISFVVIALMLALALSLGADSIGTATKRADSSQLLIVPVLMLVMLSTGMAPAPAFPDWVQPFVRSQPVSVVTETMRGFTEGSVSGGNVIASLTWCIGLLVIFGATACRLQRKTL